MAQRLSVVIPVYQRQRELDCAVRSLESEASLISEVVVVDDASPEPIALHVPEALRKKARLVRLGENVGSSAARQTGIDRSDGDLVAFLDSDDAWLPGKLAAQLLLMDRADPMTAVATGWQAVDIELQRMYTRIPKNGDTLRDFTSGCWYCPGSTVMISRAALDRVGASDPGLRRLEDFEWFLRFALAGGRVLAADVIGALIRRTRVSNRDAVYAAAERIARRYAHDARLDRAARRDIGGYLDLERGFSALYEHNLIEAAGMLARSFIRRPRSRGQLRDWWRVGEPFIDSVSACQLLGISPAWPSSE